MDAYIVFETCMQGKFYALHTINTLNIQIFSMRQSTYPAGAELHSGDPLVY